MTALYFGRDIFVPLAVAMLLSFAMAPVVRWLRRAGLPNLPAVLTTVVIAFLMIFALGWIVAWQAADLAQRLPTYRSNIEAKIDALRDAPPGGRLFERAAELVRDLGREIEQEDTKQATVSDTLDTAATDDESPEPMPVEIHEPALSPMQIIATIVGPLVGPLATAGIVIVFVIFMLLKREDLRDRVIRLAGSRDLPRTTQALDEATRRVGRYLLMQLVVNVSYAIPIGIGLWLIGIPNPVLWSLLCGVLRFVPYIGPIVAAFFPLALAIAVDPGWTTLLLVGALFIVIELLSNNFVEPFLYGASTGLSPIAIIAAAVFWTWLWGPIGLLLSTPLTVCLVVLGRHVPQLAFLDVLLGNEPVMSQPALLYQRLLVGDPNEATERAEEYLATSSLTSFYDEVAIPALALGEYDRINGRLSDEQRVRVGESAMILIDNLAEWEDNLAEWEEEPSQGSDVDDSREPIAGPTRRLPPGTDNRLILCAGARGNLDEAAAAMLAQLLERRGLNVRLIPFQSLQSAGLRELDVANASAVALSYMNADSLAHARFLVRRLRRRLPDAKIFLGFWSFPPEATARRDPLSATGADMVATSLAEAVDAIVAGLSQGTPSKDSIPSLAVVAER